MPELTISQIVLAVAVVIFTLATAIWDFRVKRIPNLLTVPFFFLGLVYQLAFHGLPGLGSAGLGFLVGFGSLFILWLIGGGGGGDVKLMGALSVWLGFQGILYVMIVSTVFVLFGTLFMFAWSMFVRGPSGTKQKFIATSKPTKEGQRPKKESVAEKQNRRIMAYAVPVALATWTVLIWQFVTL